MLAAIFTAIASLQQVLFCKNDVALWTFVKVIRLKIGLAEKVVHVFSENTSITKIQGQIFTISHMQDLNS